MKYEIAGYGQNDIRSQSSLTGFFKIVRSHAEFLKYLNAHFNLGD